MQRIAIDMDEVIVDTLQHQLNWFAEHHNEHFTKAMLDGKPFHALASAAARAGIERAMQQGDFFGEPEPLPQAVEVFERLQAKHDVYIATAAMDYPNSCGPKIAWLARYLPFFDLQKLAMCGDKRIIHADCLIDDSARHFAHFTGRGLLFSSPHNSQESRYERLADWPAVADRFGV